MLLLIGVAFAVTSDAAHAQYIFWSDFQAKGIFRADLDGENRMTISRNLSDGFGPRGLALDAQSNDVYWINDADIYRATVNGEVVNAGTIDLTDIDGRYPGAIALDLSGRLTAGQPKIYFNADAEQIYRVNPDGSDLSLLLEFNDDPEVDSLAIDFQQGRFYWPVHSS
jgi:hypothetical protein